MRACKVRLTFQGEEIVRRLLLWLGVTGILLLVLGSLGMPSWATNLISNGGFESGTADWSKYGGSFTIVSTPVHSGSSAARHALPATPAGTKYLYQIVSGIVGGTTYRLEGWVYFNDIHVDKVWMRVAWFANPTCDGGQLGTEDSPAYTTGASQWRLLSL